MQPVLVGASDQSNALAPVRTAAFSADNTAYQTLQGLLAASMGLVFNETNFDRVRGNTSNSLIASAARTAGIASSTLTNYNGRGIKIVTDITAASGTGGLTIQLQIFDAVSGKFVTVLQSALTIAISTVVLTLYPGIAAVANVSANDVLPRSYRINVTAGDGSSYTYSVGVHSIV